MSLPPAEWRLRIAHVGSDPNVRGGMPAMLRDLLESPLSAVHRLEAIPTYRSADPVDRLVVFARGLARLAVWCLRPGTRIVHVHTAVRGSWYRKAVVVALVRALRRPVILHLHVGKWDIDEFHDRIGPLRRVIFRALFRSADTVLSVSSAGAREIERHFGRDDVEVVPNAAPRVEPAGAESAAARPPDPSRPRALYLGGFHDPAKGGQVLAEALPAIVRACPSLELALAGPGELPDALREVVDANPQVSWLGWVDADRKRELFLESDVFVLPSVSEGLPVALLEAMAFGKAIVATDMGGVPDVMEAGVEGVIVAPGDAPRLAEAICRLAGDPEARRRHGEAARARAAELSPEAISARLDAIYRRAVAR